MDPAHLAEIDRAIVVAMNRTLARSGLARPVAAYSALGGWGVGWSVAALVAAGADRPNRRAWLRAASLPQIALVANTLVKFAVRRRRPDDPRLAGQSGKPGTYSFPSAHAAMSAAAARRATRIAPRAAPLAACAAAAMALSRPALGYHYASDMVAGICLGLAVEAVLARGLSSTA